jgi:hypothetical protein
MLFALGTIYFAAGHKRSAILPAQSGGHRGESVTPLT